MRTSRRFWQKAASFACSSPVSIGGAWALSLGWPWIGIAFLPALQWLLYFGAVSLAVAVVLTGIGLVRWLR